MSTEDERELLRRLEPLRLELWPVFTEAGFSAPLVTAQTELSAPAYYLAAGDVIGYPIKRGKEEDRRGRLAGDLFSPLVARRGRGAPLRVLLGGDRGGGRQRAHRRQADSLLAR